jgi:hypothetical protein
VLLERIVPKITPSNLQVTPRGRVTLAMSDTTSGEPCDEFFAPEYRRGQQVACKASLEKVGSSSIRIFDSELIFLRFIYNDAVIIKTDTVNLYVYRGHTVQTEIVVT